MRNKIVIGVMGVLLSCGGLTRAELITIAISGQVTDVTDRYGHLEDKIHVGDAIAGAYTYDSAIPDMYPSDPSFSQYWNYAAPEGMSLNIGGFAFKTDPTNVQFDMTVQNNDLFGEDWYSMGSSYNLPISNGSIVYGISWVLHDPTGAALSSDALPLTAPNLNQWSDNNLSIVGPPCGTDYFFIRALVTSATLVPEPATVFLFGLGIILARKKMSK